MKVAIVGGTASRDDAPFKDPAWEIWTVATVVERIPRVHRLFEIHHRPDWLEHTPDRRRVMRLNEAKCPVYMRETHADIPRSVAYPFEEVRARFGEVCPNTRADFFLSSIDYALALCAVEGVEAVALYGANMTGKSEYGYQLPSCQYWIGLLRGAGIPVWIHPTSPICRMRAQYGSPEWSEPEARQRFRRELAPL